MFCYGFYYKICGEYHVKLLVDNSYDRAKERFDGWFEGKEVEIIQVEVTKWIL